MLKTSEVITIITVISVLNPSCSSKPSSAISNTSKDLTSDRLAIAEKMEAVLTKGMMDIWYPLCIYKEYGGYLSNFDKFTVTWDYCKKYLIDHEHGGWYIVGLNEDPDSENADKGGIWKGNYHSARSLINCIKILRNIESGHHNGNKNMNQWHKYAENLAGKSLTVCGSDFQKNYDAEITEG